MKMEEIPQTTQSSHETSHDSTKATSRRSAIRHPIFGWILLSISFSFANVFVVHRRFNSFRRQQRYQDHQSSLPPRARNGKEETEMNPAKRNLEGEHTTIHDGGYITNILRGEKPFPRDHPRLKYRPGQLRMNSTEALQHCYVDTNLYQNHLQSGPSNLVSASGRRHKLIYRNIPKSSSSSARYAMENYFKGEDVRMKIDHMKHLVQHKNHSLVSFIREPLNRFYSSYDEAFFRMGPWMGDNRNRPKMAKGYHKTKHKVMDKYSYLYDDLQTQYDFRSHYCPDEILHGGGNVIAKCNAAQSIDNGTLVERFERFVADYDGLDPFDVHLNLQVSSLVDGRNGLPLPMAALYNASEAEKGWRNIARSKRVRIPKDGLPVGRKISRRINVAMVSDATKQKICRILALDYCCLNIELPEVCRMNEDESRVHCALEKKDVAVHISSENGREKDVVSRQLVIQPWDNVNV